MEVNYFKNATFDNNKINILKLTIPDHDVKPNVLAFKGGNEVGKLYLQGNLQNIEDIYFSNHEKIAFELKDVVVIEEHSRLFGRLHAWAKGRHNTFSSPHP